MKKKIQILGLILLLSNNVANVKSQENNLVVKFKSDTSTCLRVNTIKKFTLTIGLLNFTISDGSIEVYRIADVQSMYFENTTGLASVVEKSTVMIYPNPTSGVIYFKNLPDKQIDVRLFNLSGMEVFAGELNTSVQCMDISFLPRGIYLLKLNNQLSKLMKL